ncbi:hypothetical protein WH96_20630 [Kiloniella spongiae]|uniref:Uncharacterized protein n=1 Tax=Kiloniella spongiae TaxID=1489064 RepID=A0A0H2MQB5_9PROT|nr:hypothetical protein [Kiloniella spongiae]KLN58890.1 hypothetical protein WH96_20630 [Kiloniella spongiae]
MSTEIIGYGFDDVISDGFHYNERNKVLEIYFDEGGKKVNDEWVSTEKPCKLVIEKWKDAMGRKEGKNIFQCLDDHLGVVSLILGIKYENDRLELDINTTDDRYVTWVFVSPKVRVELVD